MVGGVPRGGILIEERRPGVASVSEHGSEQILSDADTLIFNAGTLTDLAKEAAQRPI